MIAKFALGQIVATPDALEAIQNSGQTPDFFLQKHSSGDWGDVSQEDGHLNDQSVIDGSRILSAFRTLKGEKIWIITEGKDDLHRRESTTILLPENY